MNNFSTHSAESGSESNPVEGEANFEGNDTEVLISRLRHPVIRQQIINILYEQELNYLNQIRNEEWLPHLPDGWTGEEKFKLLKGKTSGKIISADDLEERLKQGSGPSREKIEKELDEDIRQIESVTEVDYTTNEPTISSIPLNWTVPWTGERATPKQMSIIEAHEKGHRTRFYDTATDTLQQGFDLSKVQFTQEYYDLLKRNSENRTDKPEDSELELSLDDMRQTYLNHYLFTGMEIAERMSQLKNYFGFKADEKFTQAHLDYARTHYIDDTGMDNGMTLFFQGITPETEGRFIELINTSGI
ncbi:MAG: hypothetical protein AB200_02845 [Parcubacteria bacterium C7867-005]|nr:MAG: hypothetical protein AB200_02845 [Parcubacteria bacterium C7867-005]